MSSADVDHSATPPAGASGKLDKKKTIIGSIVTIAVLAIILAGIFPKLGNYSEAWSAIKNMSAAALAVIAVVIVVNICVYVLPYLAAIPGLKYWPGFIVRQTSFTVSNAIPAGGALGLAVQYAMLGSYGVSGTAATAGIAVSSVFSVLTTFALPILGVLAVATTGEVQQAWLTAGLVGLAIIIASLVVFWLILRSESSAEALGRFADRTVGALIGKITKKPPPDLTSAILHFRHTIVDVMQRRWAWITVSNLMVVFMQFLLLYASVWAVCDGKVKGLSFAECFAAFAISRLATMIPLTPGGVGTVQVALTGLMVGFGLPQDQALAAALVSWAISWVPQVLIGIITFIIWRIQRPSGWKSSDAPAPAPA